MFGMSRKAAPPAPYAVQGLPPEEEDPENLQADAALDPEEEAAEAEDPFGPGIFQQMDDRTQFAPGNLTVAELMGTGGGDTTSTSALSMSAPSSPGEGNANMAMDLLQERAAERQALSKNFQEKARGMSGKMKKGGV